VSDRDLLQIIIRERDEFRDQARVWYEKCAALQAALAAALPRANDWEEIRHEVQLLKARRAELESDLDRAVYQRDKLAAQVARLSAWRPGADFPPTKAIPKGDTP
jgi:hypothetical protein